MRDLRRGRGRSCFLHASCEKRWLFRWDELRAALTEARRPPTQPFSARTARRKCPHAAITLVADKLEAEAAGLGRILPAPCRRKPCTRRGGLIAGFRSCRSVAELLNYHFDCSGRRVQLVGGSGPEDLRLGGLPAATPSGVGFAPYSRASVLSARAAHDSGATLVAIADAVAAPMAEGADHLLLYEAASSPDSSRA